MDRHQGDGSTSAARRRAFSALRVALQIALVAAFAFATVPFGCALSETSGTGGAPGQLCKQGDDAACADKNVCHANICNPDGVCETKNRTTDPPDSKPGDCKRTHCVDGVGTLVPDPTDVDNDGNDCTTDTCVDGKPHHEPVAKGAKCREEDHPGLCDDKGVCEVPCQGSHDCEPKTPNNCTEFACNLGTNLCVYTKLDQVPVPDDPNKPKECYDDVCVMGVAQQIYDENKLPKVNSCTDVKCMPGGAVRTPKMAGTVCLMSGGTSGVCDGNKNCVECNSAADCTSDPNPCHIPTCTGGSCSYPNPTMVITAPGVAQQNGDCQKWVCHTDGTLNQDYDPNDAQDDANTCTTDTCQSAGNTQHTYLGDNTPCGNGHVCLNGHCGCDTVGDCPVHPGNEACTGGVCICTPNTCTLHCGQISDGCGNTVVCSNMSRDGNETDVDCGGAGCPGCAAGKTCNVGSDCASNHCSRGICCDQDCSGTCQSCDGAYNGGSRGTCKPIVAAQDPYNQCSPTAQSSCGTDGNCDGIGNCEFWSASGAVCGTSCASPTSETTKTCTAPNTCTATSTTTCGGQLICTGGACLGSCSSDGQCALGYFCNGSTCAPTLGNGGELHRDRRPVHLEHQLRWTGVCCSEPGVQRRLPRLPRRAAGVARPAPAVRLPPARTRASATRRTLRAAARRRRVRATPAVCA